ncbi:hypothetical protein [Bacillus sp. ISL-4]|uniref:hypothetical protein n=1 Tax=Bacillus sp. ISL-4 TaxID=2819125 RepID=UPI002867F55E|nr:hypothetical protein [Bacillus sp. ISL-4]
MLWKISKNLSIPLMALFSTESNVNLSRAGEGLRIVGDGNNWAIEPIFQNANIISKSTLLIYSQIALTIQKNIIIIQRNL